MGKGGRIVSLWEKWERDKRRAQGLEVKSDVQIQSSYRKLNLRRQIAIVAAVLLGCLAIAFVSILVEASMGRKWSDTLVVRLLIQRQLQREEIAKRQNP